MMASIKEKPKVSTDEAVEKLKHLCIVGGDTEWWSLIETNTE